VLRHPQQHHVGVGRSVWDSKPTWLLGEQRSGDGWERSSRGCSPRYSSRLHQSGHRETATFGLISIAHTRRLLELAPRTPAPELTFHH